MCRTSILLNLNRLSIPQIALLVGCSLGQTAFLNVKGLVSGMHQEITGLNQISAGDMSIRIALVTKMIAMESPPTMMFTSRSN